MFQGILLVIVLSLDSFLASLAYAARQIHIPLKSAIVIAGISAGFLGLSFLLSAQLSSILSPWIASLCSGIVFASLSVYALFQSAIKRLLRRKSRGIRLRYGGIRIVLDVYLDEEKADQDRSKTLSVREALYLALALSFDSLFSGLALGLFLPHPFWIVAVDFGIALLSIALPTLCAHRLYRCDLPDLDWLSAILFALLAILRFL